MAIKVALEHRTTYRFSRTIEVAPHVVRLRPAPHSRTPIDSYALEVHPEPHYLNWQQDPFGNWMARLVFPEKVDHLDITVRLVADMTSINPFDFFVEDYAETFPFSYEERLMADLEPYLHTVDEDEPGAGPGDLVTAFKDELPELPEAGMGIVDFLVMLNSAVNGAVEYSVRMEPGVQTPDETLRRAIGSCRDSAWLMVSLLRQYGLAARFVSGYLVQLAPDEAVREAALDGPTGPAEDFTDLHAWAEVYVPGAGWIGLDPTSALFAGEGHIPLSATPHPSSAAAITGATEPVDVDFSYYNRVTRIHEDPRVTQPYDADTWPRLSELGRAIDDRLAAAGLTLTQGGEPTFVSVDDMESPEWTTDADGPHKRERANALAAALKKIYAADGVVHRGQGKWYPGEPLPRWQIALQWLNDGTALWGNDSLLADPWGEDAMPASEAEEAAQELARTVTEMMGLPPESLHGAFEDSLAALQARLNDPAGTRTGEPDDVDVLALLSEADEAVGWVLPIVPGEQWYSPAWSFRRGKLVLIPGTSPIGLRLPLDSIGWDTAPAPVDPSYLSEGPPIERQIPQVLVSPTDGQPTTAMAFEARDGFVHVFLPPTSWLEDYISLLMVVEKAAEQIGVPVVIEGYTPPPDPRLTQLIVTPDPGVIEVNVQPSASWDELEELTVTLYKTAVENRLSTQAFDLDGLATGTGGGNHITLGGPEPEKSPMLQRPDLLASMIRYWQRHPSLSYLFSGRFIGPTSQAPRFDEGRPEAVYEMAIALSELDRMADADLEPRPWITDRALRHLLTDLTGNTHRAEFCIDKLYSPDSSRGRLGLLELRGFEMPPHPHMSLVQSLLVRSLVAMFAEQPYREDLIDWDTRLHDEMLSPYGVIRDVHSVIDDLNAAGIAFERAWLDPFVEFRFPRLGTAEVRINDVAGVRMELRAAIEPWNVLGEEATSGGTARYVDSSLERLQVTIDGLDTASQALTCNGVAVPLTPTGVPGQYVAGVRYRAWQPWSALHPTIEIHSPLTFDVVDLRSGQSVGACTYHVVHPGGRGYDQFPVNANEAEGRRSNRFESMARSVRPFDRTAIASQLADRSAEYPFTLDLRRHLPTRESARRQDEEC